MLVRRRKGEMVSLDEEQDDGDGEREPAQLVDWCCLPESELISSEARDFLEQAVLQLSPNLRAVFALRDIEGLSVRETAEALSVSEEVVKTRLLRARLKLREMLSSYFGRRLTGDANE